ncbi:MAG: Flp pilus assembly protein CpaB [Xanthobacteraceae bacterium]
MRTSTTVMIGFAVVFGLLAVFLANAWLNNRAAEQMRNLEAQRKTAPPTNTIIVAARALKFGDVLTAFSLRELPWPQNALPKGAFGRISELTAARHVVLMPIAANEPILASNITGPGGRATLSAVLQDGMKAATIRVDDVAGIAGFVLPGDRVDVMLTRPDKKINDVLVEDARVLAVDQTADQTKDKPQLVKAVTLEVSETDGQKLALSSRLGTLSLLLHKAGDAHAEQGRRVTQSDLRSGDSSLVTIAVTRPTKTSTAQDEYSVPSEGNGSPTAALSAEAAARN